MHFLSHYYIEQNNSPNSLFVVGLIIPDLTPGFSKVYNSIITKLPTLPTLELQQINTGILHHYAGDKWFHNSEPFIRFNRILIDEFIKQGLNRDRLRLSVLAHVAIEMMLDRQIVLAKPKLCEHFYSYVDNADEEQINRYFNKLGSDIAKQTFFTKFQFFKQRRYVLMFDDILNIVYGLGRIYSSITDTEFTEEEKSLFVVSLNNIDAQLRYSWQQVLKK